LRVARQLLRPRPCRPGCGRDAEHQQDSTAHADRARAQPSTAQHPLGAGRDLALHRMQGAQVLGVFTAVDAARALAELLESRG
jgi:hypothetical protein